MDMLGLILKQAGIDVEMITDQAKQIHAVFQHIGVRLEGIEARLDRVEQNLIALLSFHGLYAEPSPDVVALIEHGSAQAVREAEAPVRIAGGSRQ